MDELNRKARQKLLLVDGSNLLFQMFYGMPSRIVNTRGIPIHGVLGFVGALLKILRRTAPTHVAVLFDGEHENSRTAMDDQYKANRPDFKDIPEEDTPFSQLPHIYAALDALGVRYAETTTCETDDWIAAYVHAHKDMDIVISSFDSDFFQLISDRVSVLRYRGDSTLICTPAYIRERLGIEPWQYADFKAMTGDTADNIKGVAGIGPKTAAKLLTAYGDLFHILDSVDQIGRPSIRASLIQSTERLWLNKRLISLPAQVSIQLPFPLSALTFRSSEYTTGEVLRLIGLR